jgi:hypothetical protein
MTKWQHCEVWWHPGECSLWVVGQDPQPFPTTDWPSVFAQLGDDGWELVGTMANPSGAQEGSQ